MNFWQPGIKRALDLAISSASLILLSPLLLGVGVMVRLTSPGPALFRQKRLGKGGRPFRIYKFRSMFINAPDQRNADGSTFNSPDDPRVTPLGRFLRKTSIDEIPQLINVFKGEMSLVGPRPDQMDQLQYYAEGEELKLSVKPGITGLAQVKGRNRIPWEQRRRLDLQYVQNYSLRLDLRILIDSIPMILKGKDVYASSRSFLNPPPSSNASG